MYKFIIDTREQTEYCFKGEQTIKKTLKTGDYSIEFMGVDYSSEIAIERKTLDDFVGCTYLSRERFINELERSLEIPNFYVIIEGSWVDIERQLYTSKINPNSVIESIIGWGIKYNCHFILADNRVRGERLTKKILLHFIKYKSNKYKKKNKEVNDYKKTSSDII